MLITRCPECDTSFRITVEQLHKADGQVRCGQCAAVFSAFESLTETTTDLEPRAADERAGSDAVTATPQAAETEAVTSEPDEAPDDAHDDTSTADTGAIEPAAMTSAESDASDAPEQPTEDAEAQAISDSEVEQVLDVTRNEFIPAWLPDHLATRAQPEPRGWRIAAVCALLVLTGQALHHFRGSLVQLRYFGPVLSGTYEALGFPIEPRWDPQAFAIEARLATAQTAPDTTGSLEINAGIRNTSNEPLPYPIVRLQLTDRWEKSLGARMFDASEYLPGNTSRRARLRPGVTADVTLRVVDPGPDAYGFQVDVCVPAGAGRVRCKADAVFD